MLSKNVANRSIRNNAVLTPDMQSMTKRIYNTGDSTAFVRVELLEIKPGRKNARCDPPRIRRLEPKAIYHWRRSAKAKLGVKKLSELKLRMR